MLKVARDRDHAASAARSSSEVDADPQHTSGFDLEGFLDFGSGGAAPLVQRESSGSGVAANAEIAVSRAAETSGSALPGDVRDRFEGGLGADLSSVRVHTGAESAQAAQAVGAKAYATGQDIHFAAGQYDPSSGTGLHLLAHEVAHTVQQASGSAPARQNKLDVSAPGDALEVEADRVADALVSGGSAQVSSAPSGGIHRTPEEDAAKHDAAVKEVKDKVSALCAKNFPAPNGGGDYQKGFQHYDANHDGACDASEVNALLKDAGVGNAITRAIPGGYVAGIFESMDGNTDGKVSFAEFSKVMNEAPKTPAAAPAPAAPAPK